MAFAHARLADAGIKLALLGNAPTELLPGRHYGTLISANNFGLGKIAAEGLSPHLQQGAEVELLGYAADFFATNKRELAFTKWMRANRPDVTIRQSAFGRIDKAQRRTESMLAAYPELAGLLSSGIHPRCKPPKFCGISPGKFRSPPSIWARRSPSVWHKAHLLPSSQRSNPTCRALPRRKPRS